MKVTPEQLERGKGYVRRFGFWGGLLSWLPVLGELITVAMGFLRVNLPLSLLTIFVGKWVRYWAIIATMTGAMTLF